MTFEEGVGLALRAIGLWLVLMAVASAVVVAFLRGAGGSR